MHIPSVSSGWKGEGYPAVGHPNGEKMFVVLGVEQRSALEAGQ